MSNFTLKSENNRVTNSPVGIAISSTIIRYINCVGVFFLVILDVTTSDVTKAWSKWRELSRVICDKKIPTKYKLLVYQTVIRPTLLYGCETWPMSVKDEKRMATTEMRMVRWAMGVSLLEHRRN